MIGPLVLRDKTEQAGTAVGMGGTVLDLDGPGFGFRFCTRPGFGANHSAAVRCDIDPRLEAVPGIGRPLEGNAFADALLVGADLELLRIAFEDGVISLIHDAD